MPSQMRRSIVIAVYLLACFALFTLAMAAVAPAGLVSRRCIDGHPCSASELVILSLLWLIWGGLSALAMIRGWQGRLWGARAQR
jgi:hypothetical protein